jgi:hypothetical protein
VKSVLWILLFLLGLTGVMLPVAYLYNASKLPAMESEYDLQRHFKHTIEGERKSLQVGMYVQSDEPITFNPPDFSRLPKDLVAIYITQHGCPTYFQTPREDGFAWGWRLFLNATSGEMIPGDGFCEFILAQRIAEAMGVKDNTEQTVAANKLHSFLQKDQLIAYDLAILRFERGVVGVEDAARKLFDKDLDKLSLAEYAELQLALPPYYYYGDMKECRNTGIIKQNRDIMLNELAEAKLVPEEKAKNAIAEPVSCLSRK